MADTKLTLGIQGGGTGYAGASDTDVAGLRKHLGITTENLGVGKLLWSGSQKLVSNSSITIPGHKKYNLFIGLFSENVFAFGRRDPDDSNWIWFNGAGYTADGSSNYAVTTVSCNFHDNGTEDTWAVEDGGEHNARTIGAREWAGGFSTIAGDAIRVFLIYGIA